MYSKIKIKSYKYKQKYWKVDKKLGKDTKITCRMLAGIFKLLPYVPV